MRILARHQVGDEALVARGVFAGDHRRLSDLGLAHQGGLDLAGLDAEAADLDLLVGPAVEEQVAVLAPGGEIAGAVEPLARLEREGVGDEPLGRQTRTVPVAARQARPRNVQLPDHPHRAGLQTRVQNVNARVGIGRADVDVLAIDIAGDGADRGLGRAVFIEDPNGGTVLLEGLDVSRRERLAAHDGRLDGAFC